MRKLFEILGVCGIIWGCTVFESLGYLKAGGDRETVGVLYDYHIFYSATNLLSIVENLKYYENDWWIINGYHKSVEIRGHHGFGIPYS